VICLEFLIHLGINFDHNKAKFSDENCKLLNFSNETLETIKSKNRTHGFCYNLIMLMGRNIIVTLRNKPLLLAKMITNFMVSIVVGILWQNVSQDVSGIQDRSGLLFLVMAQAIMWSVTAVMLTFADERKILIRERANNLYSVGSYFISKICMELPALFIGNTITAIMIYFWCRLNETYNSKYFIFVGLINYVGLTGASYGFLIGVVGQDQEKIATMNPLLTVPLLVLSGFFTNYQNFAPYLLPFYYLSPFKYGYETFFINEYTGIQPLYCVNSGNPICNQLAEQNFPTSFSQDLYILIGLNGFLKILSFVLLYYTAKIKV